MRCKSYARGTPRDRLRRRYTKLHRVVGRFYIAGTFLAAPLGFYVQHFQERMGATRSFSIAAAMQPTTWMLTTAVALAFILNTDALGLLAFGEGGVFCGCLH